MPRVVTGALLVVLILGVLILGTVTSQAQSTSEIERAFVQASVESLAATIEREYFDPAVAARAAGALREGLRQGHYADAQTVDALAAQLTGQLFTLTHDKHLAVAVVRPAPARNATAPPDDTREARGRRSNFGVQRVEILGGNVGYLNLTAFYRLEEAREAITAAMQTLRNADALIVDMRDNGGGSPETVAHMASYLFNDPGMPLFEIVARSGNVARYATEATAVPDRNASRPMYVLTSARTFSAGEGFAFLLQERRRAEVIGERTTGAANPGRPYPVGTALEVTVPNGQVRTAISGKNWEGTGVTPEVGVAAADALPIAHVRALRTLLKTTPAGSWHDTLERELRAPQHNSAALPDFSGTWQLVSPRDPPAGTARQIIVEQDSAAIRITRVSNSGSESASYQLSLVGGRVGGDGTRTTSAVRWVGSSLQFDNSTCRRQPDGVETCEERSETWSLGKTGLLEIEITTRGPDKRLSTATVVYAKPERQ